MIVRTWHRWRSFTISILSSDSRRSVPIIRSQIAFARGAAGGRFRIRMPLAEKTASKAAVKRESRSRSGNFVAARRSLRSISRLRAGGVVHAPVGCAVTPSRWARREPCSTMISA